MRTHFLVVFVGAVALISCGRAGSSVQPPIAPQFAPLAAEPSTYHVIPFYQYKGGKSGGIEKISVLGGAAFIGNPKKALYSVADAGGIKNCHSKEYPGPGCGVAYELTPQHGHSYKETVLHEFNGADGGIPVASLVQDSAGSLYGTTVVGGKYHKGTAFRLSRSQTGYNETVLYSFRGGDDGAAPAAPLIFDSSGALYGTTGGSFSLACNATCGTVFKLTPSGSHYTEKVLHAFPNGKDDGTNPEAGLIADSSGNFFGTADTGGAFRLGAVFELTPTPSGDYKERILYAFGATQNDGALPSAGLLDESGVLYGTTYFGGSGSCISFHFYFPPGCGTVYKLTPHGSGYIESVIHNFTKKHLSDGLFPVAPLVAGDDGFLYGTASGGGYRKGPQCRGGGSGYGYAPGGCGVVYRLRPSGSDFRVIYEFKDEKNGYLPEGASPVAALLDVQGKLYGTTSYGGRYKEGVGFELVP
jgi:hypothetical protein